MSSLYNQQLERNVLSTFMLDPSVFEENTAYINENTFFIADHKLIYDAIILVSKSGKPIHEDFILSRLKKDHSRLGNYWENFLIEILVNAPLPNIRAFIDELNSLSNKRDIYKIQTILSEGLELSEDSDVLLSKINDQLTKITNKQSSSLFTIRNTLSETPSEAEFILKSWLPLPKDTVSLLTAPGGTGKSWLTLQLAVRFLRENPNERAFLWLSEDPIGITMHRLHKILDSVLEISSEADKKGILARLDITNDPTLSIIYEENRRIHVNPQLWNMKKSLEAYNLIVLDPLIAFFGADENNNSHARKFMQLFTEWANKEHKTILFIHHSTKNTTQSRGASAFIDAVRLVYELDKIRDKDGNEQQSHNRQLVLSKDNYAASKYFGGIKAQRQVFPATPQEIRVHKQEKSPTLNIDDIHDLGII